MRLVEVFLRLVRVEDVLRAAELLLEDGDALVVEQLLHALGLRAAGVRDELEDHRLVRGVEPLTLRIEERDRRPISFFPRYLARVVGTAKRRQDRARARGLRLLVVGAKHVRVRVDAGGPDAAIATGG